MTQEKTAYFSTVEEHFQSARGTAGFNNMKTKDVQVGRTIASMSSRLA